MRHQAVIVYVSRGERHLGCAIENVFFTEASMHMIHIRICKRNPQKYSIHVQMHHMFVFQLSTSFTCSLIPLLSLSPQKLNYFCPSQRTLSINAWPLNQSFHPSFPPTPYSHSTTHPFPSSTSYPSPSTHPPSSRTQPCYR